MTYCVAIKLRAGLVFAADSRTSAGVDDVSVYSKLHRFEAPGKHVLVLLAAGNLGTTQAVLSQLRRDLDNPEAETSFATVRDVEEAAAYVGRINRQVQADHQSGNGERNGFNPEATFILGGQIKDAPHDAFLIYPQGNYIAPSHEHPFLQIGETKYGKPILDRIIRPATTLETAARCAMVSLGATRRSNLTVGPPFELLIYQRDALRTTRYLRFEDGDPFWDEVQNAWAESLQRAIRRLPKFEWESVSRDKTGKATKRSVRRE